MAALVIYDIRQKLEQQEEERLSPYAVKSKFSKGRRRYESPPQMRTEFQRDRDRIIHSKSFRRLKHKTQVFIAPLGDHYVTRLTHTLEVSQIARTIARALNLNEDLVEAISLGHDLGHTPFGHIGEEVLNELYPEGFKHNEQSLRVVDLLENDGKGLNLTWEVREGILKHSKTKISIFGNGWEIPSTLEAQVVKIADSVAYINHDIGDAIRAGLIAEEDLPSQSITILGSSHSERINTMVCDIVEHSWAATGLIEAECDKPIIGMGKEVVKVANILRQFLFEKVYEVQAMGKRAQEARETVCFLYEYFTENPDKIPENFLSCSDSVSRAIVDYIAGMTDQFALQMAHSLRI